MDDIKSGNQNNDPNLVDVSILNGTVTGCEDGINLTDTGEAVVKMIRAVHNKDTGIATGIGRRITNNTSSSNGFNGINAGFGSTVAGNVARMNDRTGIVVLTSTATGNTATSNGHDGILAFRPSTW